ncbi:hypothetical protein ACFPYJ_20455 [Paenibacillus solisilvae]|uniref:Zinc-finger domain-containing protein n=1 Tax=Paenibacillus solisilvae TaxID=2486751 RepID=A0ABW0W0M0_9BACL
MSHGTPQEWQAYAAGTLSVQRRDELESHLYGCEECLAVYMDEMTAGHEKEMPAVMPAAGGGFADRVMLAIQEARADYSEIDRLTGSDDEVDSADSADSNKETLNRGGQDALPMGSEREADRSIAPADDLLLEPAQAAAAAKAQPRSRRLPLIRKPLFQYAVAAAVTIILVAAGVFQDIEAAAWRTPPADAAVLKQEKPDETFSQRLMEKTTSLLDNIHSKRTGGHSHE